MPTYEYQCKKCSHKFEAFQRITEEPLTACPQCGGRVQRLIGSGVGLIFKGSGFYTTDYRSKEYKEKERKESGTKTPSCPATANNEACKHCPHGDGSA